MKKLTALFLLPFLFLLSACSCTEATVLTFPDAMAYKANYEETATYSVTQTEEFTHDKYTMPTVETNGYTATFNEGEFIYEVKAVNENFDEVVKGKGQSLYRVTTSLTMPVEYKIDGDDTEYKYNDTVTSTVYFRYDNYAPIYSEKTYDVTGISEDEDGTVFVKKQVYTTTVNWNDGKAELKITDLSSNYPDGDYKLIPVNDTENAIKYTEKCAIDNESLLFAIRGVGLDKDYSGSLLILDTAFSSLQSVSLKTDGSYTYTKGYSYTLNGEEKAVDSIESFVTLIRRNDPKFAGTPHVLYYENESGNNYLVKMVTSLNGQGALVYELKSLTVSK